MGGAQVITDASIADDNAIRLREALQSLLPYLHDAEH
jgi:hypothetical protein